MQGASRGKSWAKTVQKEWKIVKTDKNKENLASKEHVILLPHKHMQIYSTNNISRSSLSTTSKTMSTNGNNTTLTEKQKDIAV